MDDIVTAIEKTLTEKFDKKLAQQKEEFDIKLAKQKEEFDIKFAKQKEKIDIKFAEQIEEFDIKLEMLDSLVDSRLKCWISGVASSRRSSTPPIRAMRQAYVSKIAFCMCCGRPNTTNIANFLQPT
jgi:tRNA G10  N-methylase Trm11